MKLSHRIALAVAGVSMLTPAALPLVAHAESGNTPAPSTTTTSTTATTAPPAVGRCGGLSGDALKGCTIEQIFGVVLGRKPSADEVTVYKHVRPSRGETAARTIATKLIASPEAVAYNRTLNRVELTSTADVASKVKALYRNGLCRDTDRAGIDYWTARATAKGFTEIIPAFAMQSETQRAYAAAPGSAICNLTATLGTASQTQSTPAISVPLTAEDANIVGDDSMDAAMKYRTVSTAKVDGSITLVYFQRNLVITPKGGAATQLYQGTGIATVDGTVAKVLTTSLFDSKAPHFGEGAFVAGGFAYVTAYDAASKGVRIARVPVADASKAEKYTHWSSKQAAWGAATDATADLPGSADGTSIAFNPALRRYLMVTVNAGKLELRHAEAPQGPWSTATSLGCTATDTDACSNARVGVANVNGRTVTMVTFDVASSGSPKTFSAEVNFATRRFVMTHQ